MNTDTSKTPVLKYLPVLEIHELLSTDQLQTLLAFHVVTGCDSVSQFSGHSKKTAWQVFLNHDQGCSQDFSNTKVKNGRQCSAVGKISDM